MTSYLFVSSLLMHANEECRPAKCLLLRASIVGPISGRTVEQIQVILNIIIHFPTSEGVSEGVSEQTNEHIGARKQSEQCGPNE